MQQLNNVRQLKGFAIVSKEDMIKKIERNTWIVNSQTGNGKYTVSSKRVVNDRFMWSCSCPDHQYRHVICKHIYAVQFSLKLKAEIKKDTLEENPVISIPQEITCPACASLEILKSGFRKTQTGKTQRYACKVCGHKFIENRGFNYVRNDPKLVTLALDLYFKGISYRKIADHMKQFHDIEIAQTTPMRWVKKYLKLLSKYAEKHKADVGNIWHIDETTVFIKKENQERYYEWIWNLMDAESRYLLACQVTKERHVKDAEKPLKEAKQIANKRPDVIVSDGLQAYKAAIRNEFYDRSADIINPHVRLKDFQSKPNNNILERLNGTFRERTKVMRSLDDQKGAAEFAKGMQVYYNYIRPHQGIEGQTPAEKAKIPIDFKGNRWMTMIELAAKSEDAASQG
jgi:transposase-like protein